MCLYGAIEQCVVTAVMRASAAMIISHGRSAAAVISSGLSRARRYVNSERRGKGRLPVSFVSSRRPRWRGRLLGHRARTLTATGRRVHTATVLGHAISARTAGDSCVVGRPNNNRRDNDASTTTYAKTDAYRSVRVLFYYCPPPLTPSGDDTTRLPAAGVCAERRPS